jgi:hypothetical protein
MASEPASLDRLFEIPDPAAHLTRSAGAPATPVEAPKVPSPTRAERARRIAVAVVGAAAWLVTVVAVAGVRPDIGSMGVMAPIGAWLAVGAVSLVAVLARRDRGLPAGLRVVQHALWIVPTAYVIVAAIISTPSPVPLANRPGCMIPAAAIALGALMVAALALRGSFFSAAGWRGAAVGALAGLLGTIGVHAHCPAQDLSHLLLAHGTPILLFALAGAALGRIGGRA